MAGWDWLIVVFYVVCATGTGLYFSKKASKSTEDFFIAGRSLPWYIAGTSLAAATFSADTPLWVAALSRKDGIFANWFWWAMGIGTISTVFFFARLWRRTEAVTDIEFITQRYTPSPAVSILRVFKVFFDGVFINCVFIASITLAMAKVAKVMLHLSDKIIFTVPLFGGVDATSLVLLILGVSIVFYTVLAGLYGVVYLDTLQFILAMVGSIALGIIVYYDASTTGGTGIMEKITSSPEYKPELLNFFPDISVANLATFSFFIYIFMIWWSQAPAGYFFVQRLLACRTEKDSLYAFLWYNIVQYVIKTWPWILVGVLSLYYLPHLKDADTAFPLMIDKFMPAGLKGVLVASLLAAFASAVNTLLNWGSSYLINDFYKPFLMKGKSQKHYVRASQIATLLLTFVALFVTTKLHTIIDAYFFLNLFMGGMGTVLILRWYWWRVNTYSEISALISTLVIAISSATFLPDNVSNSHIAASIRQALGMPAGEMNLFAVRLIITIVSVAAIWIIVTLLTSKTPSAKAIEFYGKMRIGGFGWKKVSQVTGIQPIAGEFKENVIAWLACTVLIMGLMLSIGYFLFHKFALGVIYLAAAAISGFVLRKLMNKMKFL